MKIYQGSLKERERASIYKNGDLMSEFEVEITEILSKKIKFKAKDQHEACKIAKKAYEKSEIVLEADDFTEVKFKSCPQVSQKIKVKNE